MKPIFRVQARLDAHDAVDADDDAAMNAHESRAEALFQPRHGVPHQEAPLRGRESRVVALGIDAFDVVGSNEPDSIGCADDDVICDFRRRAPCRWLSRS